MKVSLFVLLSVCASLNHFTTARMLKSTTVREATLSGRCFSLGEEKSMTSEESLIDLRFNMYRDGDVLAVYQLQNEHQSLAGCADACLLDWKVGTDNQANGTVTATTDTWAPVNTTEVFRECEAFNFNINTGKCTLISGQTYAQLTSSDNYWSGKLVCDDLPGSGVNATQDWAEQVVA